MSRHLDTRSPGSLLADSIEIYMKRSGILAGDDIIRSFFRSQVSCALSVRVYSSRPIFRTSISCWTSYTTLSGLQRRHSMEEIPLTGSGKSIMSLL